MTDLRDANPGVLDLIHADLRPLSRGDQRGRKAEYTSEHFLRALIVHQVEGTSLRENVIRVAHSPFLQNFIRLGTRKVMDFTLLDKSFKAIQPGSASLASSSLPKRRRP